jgi:hypothetical protein
MKRNHTKSEEIINLYIQLQKEGKKNCFSENTIEILSEIFLRTQKFLNRMKKINLISKVAGKSYFAFALNEKTSRAINTNLYNASIEDWMEIVTSIKQNNIEAHPKEFIDKVLYTIVASFIASIDLIKSRDQKTTGTFFEYFIAFLFSWRVGVEPKNSIQVLNIDDEDTKLPTDYIFNLGNNNKKFHMPVKLSTRERSIMLWAHQKLLDGVYGIETFMGTPVLFAETKTSNKNEVIEICLPEQWRLYQLYIAKLKRIYYLDVPKAYEKLSYNFPPLIVKPFSEFFFEWNQLLPS